MNPLLLPFAEISEGDFALVGGKTHTLARLLQAGFSVPVGAGLTRVPESEEEWQKIFSWWQSLGRPALAVRSSGIEEDSKEHSFAGQHRTYLDVNDPKALREAVLGCFASGVSAATAAYRAQFENNPAQNPTPQMGVTLQTLIRPEFAGVCFTRDPRQGGAGFLEFVRGLGESLVSGHETPVQVKQSEAVPAEASRAGWKQEYSNELFATAERMKAFLGYEADIEWAIDPQGRLWILQARPITTVKDENTDAISRERRRLAAANSPDTLWEGQTFAEWTGSPSPLSAAIWQKAFTRAGALGRALQELGYSGSESSELFPHESVLEIVFTRPYVNLSRMETLYFGATPFVMVPKPHPHLAFRWRKLKPRALLNCLPGTWRMVRTAWRLGTGKRAILKEAESALAAFQRNGHLLNRPDIYTQWDQASLLARFHELAEEFSNQALVEPLKLMVAIESSRQTLLQAIGEPRLNEWIATRMRLPSVDMATAFAEANADPKQRAKFLARYGHRGPGELDLAQPRWAELGESAFSSSSPLPSAKKPASAEQAPPKSVREKMAEDEWALFSAMLTLREHWKDALLSLYAHLRWALLELGRESGWGSDLFWLRPHELPQAFGRSEAHKARLHALVARRKVRAENLRRVSLPMVFALADLEPARAARTQRVETGESLSGGLAFGEVRLVSDPSRVDWSRWPENAVLVAENTDPGWTPLFVKARAVITERGGALSHCAIVAREMGLPAVSGIQGCMQKFKEGEHVWVDGTCGIITRA